MRCAHATCTCDMVHICGDIHYYYTVLPRPKHREDTTQDSPKNSEEEKDSEPEYTLRYTGRTASGMIRDMFNPYTVSSPGKAVPPSPSTTSTSSASNDSVFASPEHTSSYSENTHSRGWKIPREMYGCQEELSAGETMTSEEEGYIEEEEEGGKGSDGSPFMSSKHRSSITSSDISTSTSEEATFCKSDGGDNIRNGMFHGQSMLSIDSPSKRNKKKVFGRSSSREERSSPDRFLQNFNPKNTVQKMNDSGYCTFRRPNKKSKGKKRFSMKPPRITSVVTEISSPAAVMKSSISTSSLSTPVGEVSLVRHPAFRSKRGTRIGQTFSDTIPEASFTLEISIVNVVFKSTKMEVPCRGEGT